MKNITVMFLNYRNIIIYKLNITIKYFNFNFDMDYNMFYKKYI